MESAKVYNINIADNAHRITQQRHFMGATCRHRRGIDIEGSMLYTQHGYIGIGL